MKIKIRKDFHSKTYLNRVFKEISVLCKKKNKLIGFYNKKDKNIY